MNLLKGASGRSLGHIPLEDLLIGDSSLQTHINGAASAASQGADDDNAGQTPSLGARLLKLGLDFRYQGGFAGVALDAGQGLAGVVRLLPGPVLERQGAAVEAGGVSELGDATTTGGIYEELEVEEGAASAGEAG